MCIEDLKTAVSEAMAADLFDLTPISDVDYEFDDNELKECPFDLGEQLKGQQYLF